MKQLTGRSLFFSSMMGLLGPAVSYAQAPVTVKTVPAKPMAASNVHTSNLHTKSAPKSAVSLKSATQTKSAPQKPLTSKTVAMPQTASISKTFVPVAGTTATAKSNTENQKRPRPISPVQKNVFTANSALNLSAAPAPVVRKSEEKTWNLMGNLSRATSMKDFHDDTRKDSVDFTGRVGLKLDDYSASSFFAYSKNLKEGADDSDWIDTVFSVSRKAWVIANTIKLTPSLIMIAPTSKDSRERQNLMGGIGPGLGFGFDKGILPEGLVLRASVNVLRLVHAYEEAQDGAVNTQWTSAQMLGMSYDYKSVGFSIDFVHRNGLTYQGSLKEKFEHIEELYYNATPNVALAVGHALFGAALKADGETSNYAVTNERDSLVYAGLTITY